MGRPADRGRPIGERCDPIPVADEDVSSAHLKRAGSKISSTPEVIEDLIVTTVGTGDAVGTGHRPGDVRSEELFERGAGSTRVKLILGLV